MAKISQCMIVKNEEKNIERALSWGKGLFYEQIVVDTGSIDHTVELAEKLGAKIYHFTWIDDFAAAKNFALEQAKGEWIVFLDADEFFLENDRDRLKAILEIIDKNTTLIRGNALLCAWTHLNRKGIPYLTEAQIRIFRNDKNIRYVGEIHEQILGPNGMELTLIDATSYLTIFHTGYASETKEKIIEKADRNIRLIKKQLELDPEDANYNLYMADALGFKGDEKGCAEYTMRALKRKETLGIKNGIERAYSRIMRYLLEYTEDTKDSLLHMQWFYKEATEASKVYPDYDIFLAFAYLKKANDWNNALIHLEKARKKLEIEENKVNGSRGFSYAKEIYYYLTLGYFKKGNHVKCVQSAAVFLKMEKYHEEVLRILLSLLKNDNCDEEAIYQFFDQIYQFEKKKDLLFVQKVALLEGMTEFAKLLKTKQEKCEENF